MREEAAPAHYEQSMGQQPRVRVVDYGRSSLNILANALANADALSEGQRPGTARPSPHVTAM